MITVFSNFLNEQGLLIARNIYVRRMVSCGMRKICEVFSKQKKREKEKKTPTVIRIFREFLGIPRSMVFCIGLSCFNS